VGAQKENRLKHQISRGAAQGVMLRSIYSIAFSIYLSNSLYKQNSGSVANSLSHLFNVKAQVGSCTSGLLMLHPWFLNAHMGFACASKGLWR